MAHKVVAFAGSPRRNGNSEELLKRALAGVAEADPSAEVRTFILNEMRFLPCQNCGYCTAKGACRFAETDDMKPVYEALESADRFILASPIYFATVSAQLKAMIDRCQAIWARKYLLKQRHPNAAARRALFLCCGGFKGDRFYKCARQVITAWCAVCDITLTGERFYERIDARGDIAKHPTALDEAFAAGKELMDIRE